MKTLSISNLISAASSTSRGNITDPMSSSVLSLGISSTAALVRSASAEGDHSHATPTGDSTPSSDCYTPSNTTSKTLKPITELLTLFQSRFAAESANLALDDPKLQLLILTYTQLNHLANIERINESLDLAGQGPRLPALLREMNKALALQERATARYSREQAARDREVRRIRREEERKEREAHRVRREEERKERDRLKAESMARCAKIKLEIEEVRLECARIKAVQKEQADRERAQRKEERAAKAAAKHSSKVPAPTAQSE